MAVQVIETVEAINAAVGTSGTVTFASAIQPGDVVLVRYRNSSNGNLLTGVSGGGATWARAISQGSFMNSLDVWVGRDFTGPSFTWTRASTSTTALIEALLLRGLPTGFPVRASVTPSSAFPAINGDQANELTVGPGQFFAGLLASSPAAVPTNFAVDNLRTRPTVAEYQAPQARSLGLYFSTPNVVALPWRAPEDRDLRGHAGLITSSGGVEGGGYFGMAVLGETWVESREASTSVSPQVRRATVPRPSATRPGDVLYAFTRSKGGALTTPPAPVGWQLLHWQVELNGTSGEEVGLGVYQHEAAASDPASWTFDLTSTSSVGNSYGESNVSILTTRDFVLDGVSYSRGSSATALTHSLPTSFTAPVSTDENGAVYAFFANAPSQHPPGPIYTVSADAQMILGGAMMSFDFGNRTNRVLAVRHGALTAGQVTAGPTINLAASKGGSSGTPVAFPAVWGAILLVGHYPAEDVPPPPAPQAPSVPIVISNPQPVPLLDLYIPPHTHHTVSVYEKGGMQRLFDLRDPSLVRWARELDATSEATTVISPQGRDEIRDLQLITAMRHELVIFFNGKRCWEGPITLIQDHPGQFTLKARDVSYYLNRMVMKQKYSSRIPPSLKERVIDRMLRIIITEGERFEQGDLPINVLPYVTAYRSATDALTSKVSERGECYVFDELDSLAWRNGVDYSVAGRRLYMMDTDTSLGETRRMTSEDFTDPVEVVFYGAELATEAFVTDRQGRFVSNGPGYSPYYGRVELLHGNYAEADDPDAAAAIPLQEMREQAVRDFAPRYPLPMTVRVPQNATLKHDVFLELYEHLFPGVRIPITAGGVVHNVSRMMKLKKLTVSQTSEGVVSSVTLAPASEAAVLTEDG